MESLQGATPQERGYHLERLLYELAVAEGVAAAPSYRAAGEQVDALLDVGGRFLLVEVKWTADPVSASEVYAFRAKVEGKLVGTLGMFVSVTGFAAAVPDVLRYGKQVNVLLADHDDLVYAFDPAHGLAAVIRAKLRGAAQYGEVFYPFRRYIDERPLKG